MNFVEKLSLLLALICLIEISDAKVILKEEDNVSSRIPDVGIIDGQIATAGMFPYIVSLISTKHGIHFCGGSLISNRFVLTAAHCAQPIGDFVVAVGIHDFEKVNRKRIQVFEASKVLVHSKFLMTKQYSTNDIALIKLSRPVKFKTYQNGIGNSAKIELENYTVPIGSNVTASGWGVTEATSDYPSSILKYGKYKLMGIQDCSEANDFDGGLSTFCVGTGQGTDSPCYGDSGGPLIRVDSETKKVKLIGIASYLSNRRKIVGGMTWKNVVFTKVSYFIDWIESITGPL